MNHSLNTGPRGSNRDIGLHGSAAGKGDAERIGDREAFKQNLDDINFPGVEGLERVKPGRLRKVYGKPAAPQTEAAEFPTPKPPSVAMPESPNEVV